MIVLTIDQQASRRVGDRVDDLLADLAPLSPRLVRAFERTVGDEVQTVLDDPVLAVDVVLDVLRRGGWTVGVGAGPVDTPLPASTRAGSGAAFVHARTAVERAKSRARAVPLAVDGAVPLAARDCDAVLTLTAAIAARRTPSGWAVVDAVRAGDPDVRQEDVAAALGITQQAVSQRLRAALWTEEVAARSAAARLLAAAADPRQYPWSGADDAPDGRTGDTAR